MDGPLGCLEISAAGDAVVARFTIEVMLSGQLAETFGDQVGAALGGRERPLLVVDFANVQSISSLGLAKLVTLNRAAEAAGGRLAMCNLQPMVHAILQTTRLTLLLRIYASLREALDDARP
jgi:anti-anti-sigma factor